MKWGAHSSSIGGRPSGSARLAGFVRLQLLGATAFAPVLAGMDPAVRPFVADGVLVVPTHAHVALARA
jgi:hypothetical protein